MASKAPFERRQADQHPVFKEAQAALSRGALRRREFLRIAALLGVGAGGYGVHRMLGGGASAQAETAAPSGVLRCAMAVHGLGDPALAEWVEPSNLFRHQYEYLTITGADNITRPMLARRWSASDDLKTWSFSLQPEARWRDGRRLTAQDVAWNVNRWLDPALGSSNASLLSPLRGAGGGVEVVDDETIRFHLSTPMLALPESLYNYPTAILPPSFEGDPLKDRNGTGAYEIVSHAEGERCVLRRAATDHGYWGADVPHIGAAALSEIHYNHFEAGDAQAVEAMMRDEIDIVHQIDVDALSALTELPGVRLIWSDSAMTGCMRMRIAEKPFDDLLVRRALQLSCDPAAFPDAVFSGRGRVGAHHHVAPIHPEYFGVEAPARDIAEAKRLLNVAGHSDGLALTLTVGNTSGAWQQRACETLAAQAAEAGFKITVEKVSAEHYRRIWKTTSFGLTQWVHRPLGTMALSLGYRSDAPWNETGFADPVFDADLDSAEALLDIRARRQAMKGVEQRLQDAAVMIQPFWAPVFLLAKERVKGLEAQPAQYHQFNRVRLAG